MSIVFSCGLYMILNAFSENLNLFLTPSQILNRSKKLNNKPIRIGGLVKKKSVEWSKRGMEVDFILTDGNSDVRVHYKGVVPQLFREGQGLVVNGVIDGETHVEASSILAKHDENYRPPGVGS